MQCRFPPPLTEDQISAAIDGEVEPGVLQHLSQCTSCMSRLEQARRFEQALRARLYRWDCPPVQQLGDYHLGLLSQAGADAIARHLGQCERCRAVYLIAGLTWLVAIAERIGQKVPTICD